MRNFRLLDVLIIIAAGIAMWNDDTQLAILVVGIIIADELSRLRKAMRP